MMSLESIKSLNSDAGKEAKYRGLEPKVLADGPHLFEEMRRIPNLGDYEPPGWEFLRSLLVDVSGLGAPNEPAYTLAQFQTEIRTTVAEIDEVYGWAIISQGQFQVSIGLFKAV